MQGMIKSYDDETHELMCKRIREITENIALAMECKCEVSFPHFNPAVINQEE